jgi:hypothetical protein
MTPEQKLTRIKQMALELAEMFPAPRIGLSVANGAASIALHGCNDYQQATDMLRSLGMGKRDKQVLTVDQGTPSERVFTTIEGAAQGVSATVYCDSLPPTCRIETVTERIPKRETVDTGEFIEVQKRKVVCTGAELETV